MVMTRRKAGTTRRQRLLDAGSKVFAEKGYRSATVAEISEAAGANVALINYYFGSKEGLYVEVWRQAFQVALERYPFDGGLGEQTSAEERLEARYSDPAIPTFHRELVVQQLQRRSRSKRGNS